MTEPTGRAINAVMSTVIIIPSRYGSTRFPGKPLAQIAGKSLIQRVWENATAVKNADAVYVATDDDRIVDHVKEFGGQALITPADCPTGTDRCYLAASQLENQPEIVINFQGDSPLTPPLVVESVIEALQQNSDETIATPAIPMTADMVKTAQQAIDAGQAGGTTVVFDKNNYALYFSKAILPSVRDRSLVEQSVTPIYKHIGIYGYRYEALRTFLSLPSGRLEDLEKLEQLRALENGMRIKVVPISNLGYTLWGVDNPQDVETVEKILRDQGTLGNG